MANETKYPLTLAGLYDNSKNEKTVLSSMPLDQERADQLCAAIQQCVGGKLEVRNWGGTSKAGKALPDFKLEGLTAQMVAERKAYGEAKKAERANLDTGDSDL